MAFPSMFKLLHPVYTNIRNFAYVCTMPRSRSFFTDSRLTRLIDMFFNFFIFSEILLLTKCTEKSKFG